MHHLSKIIILIIIIIIIFISYYQFNTIEKYDSLIENISVIECGTKCTEGENCSAFAYKPTENKCYLSKSSIIGKPNDGVYIDEYSKLDRRCNKINKMIKDKRIDNNQLVQNSIYMCSDGEYGLSTKYQYANLGATSLESVNSTIYDRANFDISTPENTTYDVKQIDFPISKEEEKDKNNNLINTNKPIRQNYGFMESNNEYLGQYLLGHQCTTNTQLIDCLSYCKNNPKCSGVEWNEKFINNNKIYNNVCCPKSIIKQIIPRRTKFNNGKFYVKYDIDKHSLNNTIVLSKDINKTNIVIDNNSLDDNFIQMSKLDDKFVNPRIFLEHTTPDYVKQ